MEAQIKLMIGVFLLALVGGVFAAPLATTVSVPGNYTYHKGVDTNMTITYTDAINGVEISHYNISLHTPAGVFVSVITTNATNATAYSWNFTAVASGPYYVNVTAIDTGGLSTSGISANFTINTYPTMIVTLYVPATNGTEMVYPHETVFGVTNDYFATTTCNWYMDLIVPVSYYSGAVANNTNTRWTLTSGLTEGNWTGWISCNDTTQIVNSSVYTLSAPAMMLANPSDLPIIVALALFAFIFAFLAVNIDKRHSALQVFYLMIALLIVMVGFDHVNRIAQNAAIDNENVFGIGNSAIMWVIMFTLAYFLLMLIIAAFNISNPFGKKSTEGADELTE